MWRVALVFNGTTTKTFFNTSKDKIKSGKNDHSFSGHTEYIDNYIKLIWKCFVFFIFKCKSINKTNVAIVYERQGMHRKCINWITNDSGGNSCQENNRNPIHNNDTKILKKTCKNYVAPIVCEFSEIFIKL